jgi:glycosyltransferase involved in cell wall biosynthesis
VLTVLFATRNRATLLRDALTAFTQLEPPPGGWALVIVDNGSTDATETAIRTFADRLPLTLVTEPTGGKNAALNAGLAHCAGDLIVFTDDDVFPRRDWLVRLRAGADAHPGIGIFAGRVLPRWETPPPEWIERGIPLAPTYTISDASLAAGPIEGNQVFGPNMAVRAAIFAGGARFDPSIGPASSSSYAMGSETEFVLRVMETGVRACYLPDAVVEHFVGASQLHPSWVIGRAMRFGRGQYRLHATLRSQASTVWGFRHPPAAYPRCFGVPISLIYSLCRKVAAVGVAALQFDRNKIFAALFSLGYVWGYAQEAAADGKRR